MKKIIIIGAGGFGKEVAWIIDRINGVKPTWDLLGFLDDNDNIQGKMIYKDHSVIGHINNINLPIDTYYICAIGSAISRKRIVDKLGDAKFATLIDPSAIVDSTVSIEEGVIICQNTLISVNASIGRHSSIIYGSIVGHDSKINSFVTIYPSANVSGSVLIGDCVEIGTGARIIQQKIIGNNVVIGAGAVVISDLPNNCTAVGVPARIIKKE